MATASVARPGQSLRNRRDAPRPSLAKRSAVNMDGPGTAPADSAAAAGSNKKRKLTEPYIRDSDFILRKHRGKPASLVLHLYPAYFKFEGQDGSFAYDSPMRFILEHVKKQTVPHKMMEELLQSNVAFYDGCLIVEVHNHRTAGKDKGRNDAGSDGNTVKFGLHNYNPHVTPSPYVPYPSKAKEGHTPVKAESSAGDMAAPERPRDKDGPKISTVVLHPTEMTRHEELKILANTPASEVRSKKKSNDSAAPSTAQPSTPSISVPPTPIGQAPRPAGSQKMCLEEGDFYTFQADMLMATTEPLYLNPCDTPLASDAIIDMLQHPHHQNKPPSPKTRKRTTAEVAADDAQAAEIERRMLIMDERIKATGTGGTAGEAQGAANAMPFQRFKTIDMVRQKHEEAERAKKDEEARKAMEKKEAEEQHAAQQKLMMAQRQREMMMAGQGNQQQQMLIQQRRAAQAQAQAQQQALMNAQNHAHPPQNAMMPNQQQNFQQGSQSAMAQSSPVVRQQTPMMNSSPMMPQGGFPMAQTSSQGAGSPPRPTSAMQHPMARQMSQQQRGSQNAGTPQIAQGTPNMAQAMPNRQMTQTPRMAPNSPAAAMHAGTPAMHTPGIPNQNQLSQHQMQMLEQQQMAQNNRNMMPDQIQNISNMQRQQSMQHNMQRNAMMQAAQGNPQQMAAMQQRQRQHQMMMQQQRNQQMMAQQQQGQMQHAGSPGAGGMGMPTPQMGHGHPQPQQQQQGMPNPQQLQQQQLQQRQQAAQMQAMQSIQPLIQQYGGLLNIPQQALQNLSQTAQGMIRKQIYHHQQQRSQMMRAQQQQQQQNQQRADQMTPNQGGGGGEQVPGGPGNPQYMAALRHQQQAMLSQMQPPQGGGQQQHGGMNGMTGLSFQMGGNPGQGQGQPQQNFGQQGQAGQQGDPLAQQFQAMQRALNHNGQ